MDAGSIVDWAETTVAALVDIAAVGSIVVGLLTLLHARINNKVKAAKISVRVMLNVRPILGLNQVYLLLNLGIASQVLSLSSFSTH